MEHWKELFAPHILERGWNYYEDGMVENLVRTGYGFRAAVEGTETYTVKIKMQRNKIADMECTCPYAEDGAHCKHMAAVLYELEEEEGESPEEESLTGSEWADDQGTGRKLSAENELSEVIQAIPEEEIRRLLMEWAQKDKELGNHILSRYANRISERRMLSLKRAVTEIAYRYSDRRGFVDWRNAGNYASGMVCFLEDNVWPMIDNGFYKEAFELTNAVAVQAGNQAIDDSGGESESIIESCYDCWKQILENCGETEKRAMLSWFKKHRDAGTAGEITEEYITEFLMREFRDRELLEERLCEIDRRIEGMSRGTDCGSSWNIYQGTKNNILQRLELMRLLDFSDEEMEAYKDKSRKFSEIRKMRIAEYMEKNRLSDAVDLLRESKELDKDFPGLVAQYSEKLIELYKKLDMKQEYKDELVFRVFDCMQPDMKFMEMLKSVCTQEEWSKHCCRLLLEHRGQNICYELMEAEKMYDQLMTAIEENNSVWAMNQYEKLLAPKYPGRVIAFYADYITEQAERACSRPAYQDLISYLKKIRRCPGGTVTAGEIAQEWRSRYRRRSAMMDELQKAGF